jgi:hypothetical protein
MASRIVKEFEQTTFPYSAIVIEIKIEGVVRIGWGFTLTNKQQKYF